MEKTPTTHTTDTDCTLDATDVCTVCGVGHFDACASCGGRGYHAATCASLCVCEPSCDAMSTGGCVGLCAYCDAMAADGSDPDALFCDTCGEPMTGEEATAPNCAECAAKDEPFTVLNYGGAR